jgi:hypothetical protein
MDKRAGWRGRIKSGRIVLALPAVPSRRRFKGKRKGGDRLPPPLKASAREGSQTVFSGAEPRLKGTLAGDAPYHSYLRVGKIGALFARGRSLERRTPIDETGRKLLNGGRYGGICIQTIRNALIYQ